MNFAFFLIFALTPATLTVTERMEKWNEQNQMREFDRYADSLYQEELPVIRRRLTIGEVYGFKKEPVRKKEGRLRLEVRP